MVVPVALRRALYRIAYTLLRVWWLIRRPEVTGVKFLLTDGPCVLLVRHTYGVRSWDIPGGAPKRGEAAIDAARREAGEELGVELAGWRDLGRVTGQMDGRKDTILCFTAELPQHTALTLDAGEIATVGWFRRDALPADIGRYVPEILRLGE